MKSDGDGKELAKPRIKPELWLTFRKMHRRSVESTHPLSKGNAKSSTVGKAKRLRI
jgi:hypothetical protein